MKAKPIKKMVKRFMRGAVKKLGKTAGTLIGGAALMILGGYVTNGAFGFAKGFFGGAGAASQAKSAFDLIGRAKDAFSTAGSEMSSFTEFLKGGVDKVTGNAETGTDLGTGYDQVDPSIGPPEPTVHGIQPGDTLSEIAQANDMTVDQLLEANPQITDPNKIYAGQGLNIPSGPPEVIDVIDEVGNVIGGSGGSSVASTTTTLPAYQTDPAYIKHVEELENIHNQMGIAVPGTTEMQILQREQLNTMNAMDGIRNSYTQAGTSALDTSALEEIVVTAQKRDIPAKPWYQKTEEWMEKHPKTTSAITSVAGLIAGQDTPDYGQQSPMMMGMGGYEGYGTSQTEAWRAYAPEYVAYSVDNQLNHNSYINYMSALG